MDACCAHCARVHFRAGSAAARSELPPGWQASGQAGLGPPDGCGPQPLEGAECGHSPEMGGGTLESQRPRSLNNIADSL